MADAPSILAAAGAYGVAIHYGRHLRGDLEVGQVYRPQHCYSLWVLERGTLRLRRSQADELRLRAPAALLLPADPELALEIPPGVRLVALVFDVVQVPRRRGTRGFTWVHVDPQRQPPPAAVGGDEPPLRIAHDCWRACRDTVTACAALWWQDDLAYARANARLQAWLTEYLAMPSGMPAATRHLADGEDAWLTRVRSLMRQRLADAVRIEELARAMGMGGSRFVRRFIAAAGIAPAAELSRLRIDAACRMLLLTDLPVAEVGRQCGFRHASGFSLRFRAITGQTPTAWRQAQRASAS